MTARQQKAQPSTASAPPNTHTPTHPPTHRHTAIDSINRSTAMSPFSAIFQCPSPVSAVSESFKCRIRVLSVLYPTLFSALSESPDPGPYPGILAAGILTRQGARGRGLHAWGSPGSESGLSATTHASTRGPCSRKTDLPRAEIRGEGGGQVSVDTSPSHHRPAPTPLRVIIGESCKQCTRVM